LDVVSIPTNVPIARKDLNDLIYKSEKEKFEAVINKIKELHKKGQPVLVGTASIEKSELLHEMMKKEKIPHTVLNAKHHESEALIIADAGKKGAVTVATNMAGRGVDIKIDDEVRELGGLYIIGTERHESRRIDNQLRGRSGRQGDPGVSQFYLSLEDNLLRIFGSDKIKNIMERLGIEEGEHIESGMVTRAVENAQKKVETMHYESRKHILEYDDVANEQRKVIYSYRNELLDPEYDLAEKIRQNRAEYVENLVERAGIYPGMPEEDFDLDRLISLLKEEVLIEFEKSDFAELDAEGIVDKIVKVLEHMYEQKMSVVDEKQKRDIEKLIYLQTVDNLWREHLYQMDTLKTGIGLRGYNQKDPLTEYKKESYEMFVELIKRIKYDTIKMLQNIQLRDQNEEQARQEAMDKMLQELEDAAENATMNKESVLEPQNSEHEHVPHHAGKKIARNDPCPCGSGKKYKNCCGKSGPKKGLLAK
jgi:preprotein translocase subunit SecA